MTNVQICLLMSQALHNAGANLVDNLRNYSRNVLQYFFVLEDYRDAVKEGDGERKIHKDFLLYFKTDRSFNV